MKSIMYSKLTFEKFKETFPEMVNELEERLKETNVDIAPEELTFGGWCNQIRLMYEKGRP